MQMGQFCSFSAGGGWIEGLVTQVSAVGTGPCGAIALLSWLTLGFWAALAGGGMPRGVVAVSCPAGAAEQLPESQ